MSSFNFRMGGCAWCHPGGGALEYDRAGYRYDGKEGNVYNAGTGLFEKPFSMNPDAATTYGDYYVFDPAAAANTPPFLVSKVGATAKGVAELDCLMCHLNAPYNNEARDYCMTTPGVGATMSPYLGATMALTLTGEVAAVDSNGDGTATASGSPGVNPDCAFLYQDTTGAGTNGRLETGLVVKSPKKEACALCHFPDVAKPKGNGPASSPLDWTTFQKYVGVGTFTDSDTGLLNTSSYDVAKGRAEFGKRGESLNDPGNFDAHMSSGRLGCVDCHNTLSGDFDAVVDNNGIEIQPGLTGVLKLDHQFAKGNNRPDGKNMDQLDNTVTCEGCHITGTHAGILKSGGLPVVNGDGSFNFVPRYKADGSENLGTDGYWDTAGVETIVVPVPTHAAFPALHFDIIDCRTCHIPQLNFVKKQLVSDFSTTPYPEVGIERGQSIAKKVGGVAQRIGYRPLYMWQDRGHLGDQLMLAPIALGSAFIWKDLATGLPYAKRFPVAVAKAYRDGADPNFLINSPQGATGQEDTALIANTTTEIGGMVSAFQSLPAHLGINDPSMNIYVNQFTFTHNVAQRLKALGGPESGGCAACHSENSWVFNDAPLETDANKPCYGQPQGCKGLVFMQPRDGGVGLEMTCDGGDCGTGTKRITNKISFPCPNGTTVNVDLTLGVAHGQSVNNVIPQEDVLCYSSGTLTMLRHNQTSVYLDNLQARLSMAYSENVSYQVAFNGTTSSCPSELTTPGVDTCTYSWNFGDGSPAVSGDKATAGTATHVYPAAAGTTYVATLTIADPTGGYTDMAQLNVTPYEVTPPPAVDTTVSIGADGTVTVTPGGLLLVNFVYIRWGDGQYTREYSTFSTATDFTHVYAPGTYSVYAKVRDTDGNYVVQTRSITIP